MKVITQKIQSGFALLLFVLVLLGIGGVALTGFSQSALKSVQEKKFEHNKRVLKEAKQALLMFAYNYPVTNDRGPGRLPCPDTDNDGIPNAPPTCTSFLGRLPWGQTNLGLYDIRDANGDRLWYAVSDRFATNVGAVPNIVNSDSFGNITVRDQSENIIYDGSDTTPKSGVAAVIIAPGSITSRNGVTQDRSVIDDDPFDTNPDDDPGVVNASNYLDLYLDPVGTPGEDNANFLQDSPTNGFILGPVNGNTTNVVNDQIIVITAAEVIEVAEKATLQAYRDAIDDYLNNTVDNYPWLFDYSINDIEKYYGAATLATIYPTGKLTTTGRIPSIFSQYFTEQDSQSIESEISVNVTKNFDITGSAFSDSITFNFTLSGDVEFADTGTPSDGIGKLKATVTVPTVDKFYSESSPGSNSWTACPGGADVLSDCDRDASGVLIWPAVGNLYTTRVIRVRIDLELDDIKLDYDPAPVISFTAANAVPQHAVIQAIFTSDKISEIGKFERRLFSYETGSTETDIEDSDQDFHIDSDLGSVPTGSLTNISTTNYIIRMRYYPELPGWAHSGEDDWHNSILMAIAPNFQPGGTPGAPFLTVSDSNTISGNTQSLLVNAGIEFNGTDDGITGYANSLATYFDSANADLLADEDYSLHQGNDTILVIR